MFKHFFDSRAKDALELFETTSDIEHSGEKGMLRELVVRRLLLTVLPPHIGIGTGVIIDAWDRQSKQTDLILFDRRRIPPPLLEEGWGIFPIDAVLRAIEVKSTLDQEGFERAFEAAWLLQPDNAQGLKIAAYGKLTGGRMNYPVSALFAYDGPIALLPGALDRVPLEQRGAIKGICIARHGLYWDKGGLRKHEIREQAMRRFVT